MIIAAMIVQDSEDFIELSLRSVMSWADRIIIVDGGCRDDTRRIIEFLADERFVIINHPYDKSDPGMDGRQRNVYLHYLIDNFPDAWCLVVDADECCSDNCYKLNEICGEADKEGFNVMSPHMVHYVYNLRMVDATVDKHYCPARLFKVQPGLHYPEVEHNVLEVPNAKGVNCSAVTLHHLGYIRGLFSVMNRYYKNLEKSNIHTKNFLDDWKNKHVLGSYPVKLFSGEYPSVMKDYFRLW